MTFIEEEKFKKDIGIYCIVNIQNNKIYIGQTGQNFQKRYWHHKWKLNSGTHDNKFLQNEWNKYGKNCFEYRVIEVVDKKSLDDAEKKWIATYRELGICMNLQDGGQPKHIERFISDEQRKRVGELNHKRMIGKKLSQETRDKMSKSRSGKPYIKKSTDILTEDEARKIKEMLVNGYSSHDIMKELSVPYKPINAIISRNTWSFVYVDGWDEFRNNRPKGKGTRVSGKFYNTSKTKTQEEIQEILDCYKKCGSYNKTAKELKINRETVTKYVNLYLHTTCQSCAKPQLEEGATTIRKE